MSRFLLLCMLGGLLLPTITYAQLTDDALQTTRRRRPSRGLAYLNDTIDVRYIRHELALNTIGIFQNATASPFFMYRKNWRNFGLRTGLSFDINPFSSSVNNRTDSIFGNTKTESRSESYGAFLFIGFQYHRFWGRFQLTTGADITSGYTYGYSYQETRDDIPPTYSRSQSTFNNVNLGLSPFIGGRFFFTPRLSFGFEISTNVTWRNTIENGKSERLEFNEITPTGDSFNRNSQSLFASFNLNNVRLFLSYYFPQRGMLKKP